MVPVGLYYYVYNLGIRSHGILHMGFDGLQPSVPHNNLCIFCNFQDIRHSHCHTHIPLSHVGNNLRHSWVVKILRPAYNCVSSYRN